ncbi:hypothetical protein B484DRAFT_397061, partial [Ochromonadaceae sp. CCMP2298]
TAAAKGKGKKPPVPRPATAQAVHVDSLCTPEAYAVPRAQAVFAPEPVEQYRPDDDRESACSSCTLEWEGRPSSIEQRRKQEQLTNLRLRADAIEAETARLLALESPMSRADSRSWVGAAEVCTTEAKTYFDDFCAMTSTPPEGFTTEAKTYLDDFCAMTSTPPEGEVPEGGTDVEADISALSISLSVSPLRIGETGISGALSRAFSAPKDAVLPSVLPKTGRKRAAQGPASPQGPQAPAGKENEYGPKKRAQKKTTAPVLKVAHVSNRESGGRVPAKRGPGYGRDPLEL